MTSGFTGNDRFLVLSQLGVGGMGVVYEALDCERDITVAIKTLRVHDAKQLLRLKHEFRALCDIEHPNLVELGELFEEDGEWFFTMELVEGVDIVSYMSAADIDQPPGTRIRHALRGLSAGLAALHRAAKVHCDVKPSNVLVTPDDRVVLLDFGVVTEFSRSSGAGDNPRAGTPQYIAPEQAAGRPVGPAADWYAAGVLLFRGLTGRLPFRGRDPVDLMRRKQRQQPPHPNLFMPNMAPDMHDLAELCARLLARDPRERPTAHEILSILDVREDHGQHLARARDTGERLFVGRVGALAELDAAYAASRQGDAISVFVEGESGVGKTVLIERFVDTLERDQVRVFRGQCHAREFVRYNAFDGIVDSVARFLRDTCRHTEDIANAVEHPGPLVHLFPVLRTVAALSVRVPDVAPEVGPDVRPDVRRQAFAAVRQLFRALAAHDPFALVIDDVHWADADSLALMHELIGVRHGPALLFLASARKLDDGRSCAAVQTARGHVRTISLSGLDFHEAEELARRLLRRQAGPRAPTASGDTGAIGDARNARGLLPARAATLDDTDIAALIAETGGHPMFMDELVRYLARHGDARLSAGSAHLDDALLERVMTFEPDTRRVLELVAIAGAPVSHQIVAKTAGLPAETFAKALSTLRRATLVRMIGRDRNALISAYHARVREAVYTHLDADLRRSLHFQLARVMESRGVDPVQLVSHFQYGGAPERAGYHAVEAARAAARSLAFDQAAGLYQTALATLHVDRVELANPSQTDSTAQPSPMDLLFELATALENAGRTVEAATAYRKAAGQTHGPAWLELHRRAAEQLLAGGHMEQGITAVRDVLELSGMKLPATGRRALPRVAWNFFRLQRHDLEWRTPSADDLARPQSRKQASRIDVCWTAGAGLSLVDTLRGVFFATQGARLALRLGEPYRVARSLCTASVAASALGLEDSAERMVSAAQRAAREHGSTQAMFYAETARFIHDFFYRQHWSECVAGGERLQQLWRAAGHGRGFEIDFVIQFSSWALAMRGDIEALTRFVETFVSDAQRVGNRLLEVALRVYHSLVHLAADQPQRAQDDVSQAIASWQPDSDDFHLLHAWALFSQGDIRLYRARPEDEDELEGEFRRLEKSPLRRTLWVLWRERYLVGRFALARAVNCQLSGRHLSGHESKLAAECARASTMAARLADSAAPVPRAWGKLLEAGVAHLAGADDQAVARLSSAEDVFNATDSRAHAAACAYRRGQMMGGDTGQALVHEARTTLRQNGVARPENLVAMLAPGWRAQ